LIFQKTKKFKDVFFCVKENILGYWGVFYLFQHGFFKFSYWFDRHVLKFQSCAGGGLEIIHKRNGPQLARCQRGKYFY
jgi:hypothetical protein